ncbi:MAG TPA: Flp family type IVb pilin [Rhizomicrobium sp.]|nr:Flp family type IVb pilin [Rhizomicrobium sp.]
MGQTTRDEFLSDAACGPSVDPYVARSALSDFWRDERGATAIEYAMIAAGISIFVITAVDLLGQNVKTTFFDKLATVLSTD